VQGKKAKKTPSMAIAIISKIIFVKRKENFIRHKEACPARQKSPSLPPQPRPLPRKNFNVTLGHTILSKID